MLFSTHLQASSTEKLNGLYSIFCAYSVMNEREIKEKMRSLGLELGMTSLAIEQSLNSRIELGSLKIELKGDKFWYVLNTVKLANKPSTKSDYNFFVNVANGIGLSVGAVDKAIRMEANILNRLKKVVIVTA